MPNESRVIAVVHLVACVWRTARALQLEGAENEAHQRITQPLRKSKGWPLMLAMASTETSAGTAMSRSQSPFMLGYMQSVRPWSLSRRRERRVAPAGAEENAHSLPQFNPSKADGVEHRLIERQVRQCDR